MMYETYTWERAMETATSIAWTHRLKMYVRGRRNSGSKWVYMAFSDPCERVAQ